MFFVNEAQRECVHPLTTDLNDRSIQTDDGGSEVWKIVYEKFYTNKIQKDY